MSKQKQNLISKTFNSLLVDPIKKEIAKELRRASKANQIEISKLKKENLEVIKTLATDAERDAPSIDAQLKAFNINPSTFNSAMRPNVKDKPEGSINPNILRSFSVDYPIARACIDYIKNKTTHLDWDIVGMDEEDEDENDVVKEQLHEFFKRPGGKDTSMRLFQENIIEDYLVMGDVAIEKLRTRGGNLLGLLPVDVATIKVRVDDSGRIPNPPDIAYEQWIWGAKVAELTKEDMLFRVKNARPNTPFGLSPLESLIIQVQSALAGSVYNWKFFTDSNQAEGFVEVPEGWTSDQLNEFQTYFDAMVAGDPRFQRRIKFMPSGMKYTPTKKPEDMSFEKFEMWLLQQTCSVFGVPPQDLGFTNQINKATAQVQDEKGDERVGKALTSFLEEMFTDIIHYDLGYLEYKFSFVNVDPIDLKEEAEVDDIKIKSGVLSVDEVRRRSGMDEIGLPHYVMTGGGPVLIKDILNPPVLDTNSNPNTSQNGTQNVKEDNSEEDMDEEMQRKELQQWKKFCLNSLKKGEEIGEFKANYIEPLIVEDIREQLDEISDKGDVSKVFKPYTSGEYKMVLNLRKMLNELNKIQVS